MFRNEMLLCFTTIFMVSLTLYGATPAKGLGKRFIDSCLSPSCLDCHCDHLHKHGRRDNECNKCCDACNGQKCTHTDYQNFCQIWNHGVSSWNNWELWSSCSVSCGGGVMSRTRICAQPFGFGSHCTTGSSTESKACNTGNCSVDGGWSSWQNISACSVTCGTGTLYQVRFCDSPAPSNGGQECQGDKMKQLSCSTSPCPVNGGWSSWKDVSSCSVTCGTGILMQSRECNNPKPANGGQDCIGNRQNFNSCNLQPCPVKSTVSQNSLSNLTHGGTLSTKSQQVTLSTTSKPMTAKSVTSSTTLQPTTSQPTTSPTTFQNTISKATGVVGSTVGNINMVGITQIIAGQPFSDTSKTSLTPTTQNTSKRTTIMSSKKSSPIPTTPLLSTTQMSSTRASTTQTTAQTKSTVKPNILLNATKGWAVSTTSQQVASTINKNIIPTTSGGVGSTAGNTHIVALTQIVTGPTSSSSKISLMPSTQNTSTATNSPSSPLTSPTTILSTTQIPSTITKQSITPTSCVLCSGPSYICEHLHHQEQCPDVSHQYCINKMTNNRDGTRLLERRCATEKECETDWWQNTSDRDECTKYDVTQAVSRIFVCSYCCSGPFCNEKLIPKNLYLGKH